MPAITRYMQTTFRKKDIGTYCNICFPNLVQIAGCSQSLSEAVEAKIIVVAPPILEFPMFRARQIPR